MTKAVKRPVRKKVTKAKKKLVKKATKITPKKMTNVILTVGQAKQLQSVLIKAGKNYKFLDTKISAINA